MSITSELSYSGNPSGKEILTGKMEKMIEDYNTSVEEQRTLVESIKQRINDASRKAIEKVEETYYNKQVEMHKKMEKNMIKIQEQFQQLAEEEDELKLFADGLDKFLGDVKKK